MKLLVLCQDYPSTEKPYALAYIHSRVVEYQKNGYFVKILSFNCKQKYIFEGIPVIEKLDNEHYDVLISHAPNLRSHIKFLIFKHRKFSKFIFWFHGHEVMNVAKDYPKPYSWNKNEFRTIHKIYSPIKFLIIREFLNWLNKSKDVTLVFVSEWMKDIFEKNITITEKFTWEIINNPINPVFLEKKYKPNYNSKGICIRPWDNSKYAVDLVLEFAKANPHVTIDIYGGGEFPRHYEIPINVEFIKKFFLQKEIPKILNGYHFAIMPTRLDAQGVMACEFATYGIPLITNSIPIMIEMLQEFNNVLFISSENFSDFTDLKLLQPEENEQNLKFDFNTIIQKEIKIFQ